MDQKTTRDNSAGHLNQGSHNEGGQLLAYF